MKTAFPSHHNIDWNYIMYVVTCTNPNTFTPCYYSLWIQGVYIATKVTTRNLVVFLCVQPSAFLIANKLVAILYS